MNDSSFYMSEASEELKFSAVTSSFKMFSFASKKQQLWPSSDTLLLNVNEGSCHLCVHQQLFLQLENDEFAIVLIFI